MRRLRGRRENALMSSLNGALTTETFAFGGGRSATVYVPPDPPEVVVFAADGGWHTRRLARALESSVEVPSTMVVGVHGLDDDDGRLHEYVEVFGGERFEAFERFFVEDMRAWVTSELEVKLAAERTAVWGASLGGEFALAMGLRHPEIYGAVLCASPGGGFTPASAKLPSEVPRTYLVGGTQEQWFLDNAIRWADALSDAGAEVVIEKREGEHGDAFWYDEFPRMVSWAFRH
jgi:enterochelin esterase-like enzyme